MTEKKKGTTPQTVAADFDRIIADTEEKMLFVAREAIQDVVKDMQTPVLDGGKMRVVTGFLRSTGLASLGTMPSGPSVGDKTKTYTWSDDSLAVILAKMKLGDLFHFGWTAKYATVRETYDGFVEAGVQKWQEHVDRAVKKLKDRSNV